MSRKNSDGPAPTPESITLRIAGIQKESYVDGPGIRTVVFVQGCEMGCNGCHNPDTHDPSGGTEVPVQKIIEEVLAWNFCDGVTISGGEPFQQPEAIAVLCKSLKAYGKHTMVFSGFTFENLKEMAATRPGIAEILETVDILIDGPFIISQRDFSLAYRGSTNQRLIDLRETAHTGVPVILNWDRDPVASFFEQQKHLK